MRGVEAFHRGVDAELVAERDPRSEGQHTDLKAAAAEASIFHDADRTLARVLLAVVVETSTAVGATRSRKAKIDALATLLTRVHARRGRDGRLPADGRAAPGPDRGRLGDAVDRLATRADRRDRAERHGRRARRRARPRSRRRPGAGSAAARQAILGDAVRRVRRAAEADFVVRLLTGELRQGALAGLMADAIARAAERARATPCAAPRCSAAISRDTARSARSQAARTRWPRCGLRCCDPVQPMLAATAAVGWRSARGDGTGVGRMEARRRAHPGAPARRRSARVHPQPERRHRAGARGRRGRALVRGPISSCSTAKRSASPTTRSPAASRTR